MRSAARQKKQSPGTGAWFLGSRRLTFTAGAALAVAGLSALAVTAPAQAGTASAASSPADEWQVSYSTHGGASVQFDAITASAKNDAWAVGDDNTPGKPATSPVFAHWNGKQWNPVDFVAANGISFDFTLTGAGGQPYAAFSSAPDNVWFFGENEKTKAIDAVVYNGKTANLSVMPSDFSRPLAVLAPDDVWAESTKTCPAGAKGCTVLTHWNGKTWTDVDIQGIEPSAATTSGGHAWIVTIADPGPYGTEGGPQGDPVLYRTTGSAITKVGGKEGALGAQTGYEIAVEPNGQVWLLGLAGGKQRLYHWTGSKWTQSPVPEILCSPGHATGCALNLNGNMSYDGRGGLWFGMDARYTGGKWVNDFNTVSKALTSVNWGQENSAAIPGTDSAWAVGSVPRSAKKGSATNAIVALYGPLP